MMLIMPLQLKKIVLFTSLLCLSSELAVLWIDKPLALFIHQSMQVPVLFLRVITEWTPVAIIMLVIGMIFFNYWKKYRLVTIGIILYFYLTLQLTMAVKICLKIIFGRYWPETWINHNLSLLHDGVFGFDWWHGFGNQGGFPSGHLTYLTFCCVWLVNIAPSFRYAWYFILALLTSCMVMLNYHFLGDCLAGISLGYFSGFISIFYLECVSKKLPMTAKLFMRATSFDSGKGYPSIKKHF